MIKFFNHIEEAILTVTFSAMTVVCFLQVLARYVFKIPLPWSEELLRALFVWSSCIGMSLAYRTKSHLGVDALVNLVKGVPRKILANVAYIITIAFCGFIVLFSTKITVMHFISNQKTVAMGLPIGFVSIALPIGFLFSIVRILQLMHEEHKNQQNDDTHISEGLL